MTTTSHVPLLAKDAESWDLPVRNDPRVLLRTLSKPQRDMSLAFTSPFRNETFIIKARIYTFVPEESCEDILLCG